MVKVKKEREVKKEGEYMEREKVKKERRSRSRVGDVSVKKEKRGSRSRSKGMDYTIRRKRIYRKEARVCWICNEVGHMSFMCPESKRWRR